MARCGRWLVIIPSTLNCSDGKETDPRTPKQRAKKWDFSRVERMAQFTREDVREHLKLKAELGHCKCEETKGRRKRILCKTICGTLLGPNAKDGR